MAGPRGGAQNSFFMQKLLSFFLAVMSVLPAFGQGKDSIIVSASNVIAVSVSGPADLETPARTAFSAHGAFTLQGKAKFEIKFAPAGAGHVKVDVTDGAKSVLSQTFGGTTPRNALFRAADAAVKAITGQPGFFASKLAFISDSTGRKEIYVSDLFLGDAKRITNDSAAAFTPRWSPDGSKLIYTSLYQGAPDIYLIDLAANQRKLFASFKGTNSGARFSPDGSRVAMVLSGAGNPEIYTSNAQGRDFQRLTRTADAVESSPCYSPDGKSLVFVSDQQGKPQLFTMSASGGQPRRVTSGYAYSAEPDWNRVQTSLIAFTAGIGRGFQVGVCDVTGKTRPRIVTNDAADAVEPVWLADGRHILYTAKSAGKRSLVILDTGVENGKRTVISKTSVSTEKPSVWW